MGLAEVRSAEVGQGWVGLAKVVLSGAHTHTSERRNMGEVGAAPLPQSPPPPTPPLPSPRPHPPTTNLPPAPAPQPQTYPIPPPRISTPGSF